MRPDTTPSIDPPQERHRREDEGESSASATRSMGDKPEGKPNRLPREVRAVRKGIIQEEAFQKEIGRRRKDQIEILRQRAEEVDRLLAAGVDPNKALQDEGEEEPPVEDVPTQSRRRRLCAILALRATE